ncbi:hypothetical protein GCM10010191_93800 [Actinomadura vinacea]|uniref:DUF559 domain-containing protein n=1 Tax=Actinomadura vinacea TaxID=115336 RepID=A0ABN3KG53_9ACTN
MDAEYDALEYAAHLDHILGQTTGLLAQRGDDQAVALLIDVHSMTLEFTEEIAATTHESWGDGPEWTRHTYHRVALLDVDEHIIPRFTDEVCERIIGVLSYVADRNNESYVSYVKPRAALPEIDVDWRTSLASQIAAEQATNQARRERRGVNRSVEDDLTFGSTEELRVYQALKHLQSLSRPERTIALAPLPGVYLREGHTWTPDLLVMGGGRLMVVEVDGPHHRAIRRRADDRNRDLQWERCGVHVVRLPVEDLRDDQELEKRLTEEIKRHLYP